MHHVGVISGGCDGHAVVQGERRRIDNRYRSLPISTNAKICRADHVDVVDTDRNHLK